MALTKVNSLGLEVAFWRTVHRFLASILHPTSKMTVVQMEPVRGAGTRRENKEDAFSSFLLFSSTTSSPRICTANQIKLSKSVYSIPVSICHRWRCRMTASEMTTAYDSCWNETGWPIVSHPVTSCSLLLKCTHANWLIATGLLGQGEPSCLPAVCPSVCHSPLPFYLAHWTLQRLHLSTYHCAYPTHTHQPYGSSSIH